MNQKLYFRTNTNKTNKSILGTKHNETNSKTKLSMLSSFTDTKLEGKSIEEPGKVFERLIKNYHRFMVMNQDIKDSGKMIIISVHFMIRLRLKKDFIK